MEIKMDDVINKAAKANYIADRMIIEITETRDKYDAAQAFPDSSIIYEIENNSRQKLKELKSEFEQTINDLIGELKK